MAATEMTLAEFKQKLSNRESSGSYTVKGVQTKYGRALGKYQVMEAFLPDWSRQYLGRLVSPAEFLASPQLQEAFADARFTELRKKYGNWDDVASVHFTGRPLAQAVKEGARDALGTDVMSYVKDITGKQFKSSPQDNSLFVSTGQAAKTAISGALRSLLTKRKTITPPQPVYQAPLPAVKAQVQAPIDPIHMSRAPEQTQSVYQGPRDLSGELMRRFHGPVDEPLFVPITG